MLDTIQAAPDYTRQRDVVDLEKLAALRVGVIGAGGIGSPTTVALAKLGVGNIRVWDDDGLEAHNLPSQFYPPAAVGLPKVKALQDMVEAFTGSTISVVESKFDYNSSIIGTDIVISGVDTMKTRAELWHTTAIRDEAKLYIEARMTAELCRIYTIQPDAPDRVTAMYERQLYSDEQAVDLPCTARATVYCCWMIAALITGLVKKFVMWEPVPNELIFDLVTYQVIQNTW